MTITVNTEPFPSSTRSFFRRAPNIAAGASDLPAEAQRRLDDLLAARADAHVLAHAADEERNSAGNRVDSRRADLQHLKRNAPPPAYGGVFDVLPGARQDADWKRRIESAEQAIAEATNHYEAAARKAGARFEHVAQLDAVIHQVKEYLSVRDRGDDLKVVHISSTAGMTIEGAQLEVDELRAEIHATCSAPIPSESAKAIARAQVDRLAAAGTPNVIDTIERGSPPSWDRISAMPGIIPGNRAPIDLAIVAWLHRDAIVAAMEAEIDRYADEENALSDGERARRLAQLDEQLLAAERTEVAMIDAERGNHLYRSNTDPRAILGIESRIR